MVSYAYDGSSGGPDTYDETGAIEHHYPQPGATGLEFAKPRPAHTLTPEAEEAREMVRRHGRKVRLDAELAALVTDHGNPHVELYDGPVPAAAKRIERKALASGMRAHIITTRTGHVVEGISVERGVAFRLRYLRGKADGGTWHEKTERWTLIKDDRPVGVNALTRTALAGKRAAGMSATRLKLIASPHGIPFNATEIERRIDEL